MHTNAHLGWVDLGSECSAILSGRRYLQRLPTCWRNPPNLNQPNQCAQPPGSICTSVQLIPGNPVYLFGWEEQAAHRERPLRGPDPLTIRGPRRPRTKLSDSFQSGLAMEAGLLEDELEEEFKSLAGKTRLPLSRKWRELRCFLSRSIITILLWSHLV